MFAASKSGKPAASGAVTDPNFNNTVLLLETTGTNGQQNNTFLDSSTNNFTLTRTGTPTQGTFTPFSQTGWSGYFNAAGNKLSVSAGTSFAYGTGDFTVEAWVNPYSYQIGAYLGGIILSQTTAGQNYFVYLVGGSGEAQFIFGSGGGTTITTAAGLVPLNTWTHIALVRSGTGTNQTKIYVNGTSAITSTCAFDFTNVSYAPTIATYTSDNTSLPYAGYISNLRVVKGTAVYTSNFTPSTTPLTAVSGTSLLTLQSNYFKDNSSNNFAITATGTPSTQAFSPFAPAAAYSTATVGGSGYFNGTTDYLTVPNNANLNMGTSDFTAEAWVYLTSTPGGTASSGTMILNKDGQNTVTWPQYALEITSALKAGGSISSVVNAGSFPTVFITGATTLALNTWNHIALTRIGTAATLWVNGVSDGTSSSVQSTLNSNSGVLSIGYEIAQSAYAYFPGYISNARVVKGTAVYTANFTPSTTPLTAITNTSLLLNGTNAGIYDATAKNLETTVGSAQASTAQSKFGGSSMLFNGTTDYLTTIDKPIAQLGTGDFTIEGWVYLSAVGTARGLVSKGAAATGWSVGISALNQLTFAYTASTLTASTTLVVSTWYYFAVVRSGTATGNVKIYLNGTVDATSSGAITDNFNQTSTGYIGADRVGTSLLSGYLDEVRVTRVARTITTPTAAFPTS